MKTYIQPEVRDFAKLKNGDQGFIVGIHHNPQELYINKKWIPIEEVEIVAARRLDMYDEIILVDHEPRPPRHLMNKNQHE